MNRNARLRRSQSCTTPAAAADTNEVVDGGYDRFGKQRHASAPKSRPAAASDSGDKGTIQASRLFKDKVAWRQLP